MNKIKENFKYMKNFILRFALAFVLVLAGGQIWGQGTYTWIGAATANFQVASNWSPIRTTPHVGDILQFTALSPATTTCTNVPTQTISRLIVSGSRNVTLQSNAPGQILTISGGAGNNLDVQSGSTLYLSRNADPSTITLNFSGATQNVLIAGTLRIYSPNSYDASNSNTIVTGRITNAGTITSSTENLNFNSGAAYRHNNSNTPGTIPTATWHLNSTLEFYGYTSITVPPAGLNQTFGNVNWNCAGQTSAINLGGALNNIAGNFTITNTNRRSVCLTDGASLNPLSIGGNLILNGGRLILTRSGIYNVNISGNFSIASGAILNMDTLSGVGTINLNGNFSIAGGTITESGSSNTNAINFVGPSTQVFLKTGGTISNTVNFVVNPGSLLDMGTSVLDGSEATFTLSSGAGLITANSSGISSSGASGSIQTYGRTYSAGANYTFNGLSSQVTGNGLVNANNLTINNTSGVSLSRNVAVSNRLTLNSGNLILGNHNITVTLDPIGPFDKDHMIVTDGSGSYIKTGLATSDFLTTYPVGTYGYYSPMIIQNLSATTGTGTISVRAVSSKHSNVPYSNDALLKYWAVSTTGLSGVSDAMITFAYSAGEVIGNSSFYETRIWNGTSLVVPDGRTPAGLNPFGTNAPGNSIINGDWTALDPTPHVNFYSYSSGDWDNYNTWTLDPSGALFNNPLQLTPGVNDKVIINTGHTVNIPSDLDDVTASSLTVEGTLDLGATVGHSFGSLKGSGRIRISNADNFPETSPGENTFFTIDKGTLEYYGNSFSLVTARDIYNLDINMISSDTLTLLATPYNISGNLTIQSGTFKINDNSSTTKLRLTVLKNILVKNGASFTVGTADMLDGTQGTVNMRINLPQIGTGALQYYLVYHSVECYGDFINNGKVRFTNQAAPVYNAFTTTGAVSLFMKGASNNSFTCNGTTDLYNLIVDKGTDRSYVLTLYASNQANFRLYGLNSSYAYDRTFVGGFSLENPELRKALWIRNGTLELTGYVFIPSLTEAYDYGDYFIPSNGGLWINGDNVIVWSTDRTEPGADVGGVRGIGVNTLASGSQSFSIFGDLKVSKGYFSSKSHGVVLWYQSGLFGNVIVEGGVMEIPGIRTADDRASGNFSFHQSGGLIQFRGNNGNEYLEYAASLCIRGGDCAFTMTGGTMEFYDGQNISVHNADNPSGGIIRIETNPANISVTGGKIKVIRNSAGADDFRIYSTAPFYNLEFSGTSAYNLTATLNSPITVIDSLTINDYATLDVTDTTANNNVTIGGNLTIGNSAGSNNAFYNSRLNTTTFNGDKASIIRCTNNSVSASLVFHNLIINKTPTGSIATAWPVSLISPGRAETAGLTENHLATINGNLTINSGKWNNFRYKTSIAGNITNLGSIINDVTNPGRITLENGNSIHKLTGSTSSISNFGNLELNDTDSARLFTSIATENFILSSGVMNIDIYNLAIGGSLSGSGFGLSKMIQTNGASTSQGLTLSLSLSGSYPSQDIIMPVGVGGSTPKYTPLTINLNGNIGTGPYTGNINLRPVDNYHPSSDPAQQSSLIPFYWSSNVTGNLSSIPSGMVNFTFASSYSFDYSNKFDTYYRNNTWTQETDQNLIFSGTGFVNTDYSVGLDASYRVTQHLYSRQSGNWNSVNTWSLTGHGIDNPPIVLNSYDIFEIGGYSGSNHQVTVTSDVSASEVIIQGKSVTGINSNPAPSLIVNTGTTNIFNVVSGGGRIVLNNNNLPTADYFNFCNNDEAIFEYSGGDYTIPSTLSVYPTLKISGSGNSQKTMSTGNILVRKSLNIYDDTNIGVVLNVAGNITVNDSLNLDNQSKLVFPNGTSNYNVTVLKNINCVNGGSNETNSIEVANGGEFKDTTHQLIVHGDIRIGASTFTLWNSNTSKSVNLVFNGETNSRVYNYSGVINLSRLYINKASPSLQTIFDNAFSLNAASNIAIKPLGLTQGVLRINNSATSLRLSGGWGNFVIPSVASLVLDQGRLEIIGNNIGLTLNGLLEINGGAFYIYNSGNTNNYIQYSSTGNSALTINGGLLRVGSQIRRFTTNTGGTLKYTQTGGSVEIGYRDAPISVTNRGMLEVLNDGSSFTFTGGNLSILKAPADATFPAFYLDIDQSDVNIGANTSFTFGGVGTSPQIGIYSAVPLSNVIISGTGTPTVKMWTIPLTLNGNLTINSGGSFDANGLQLTMLGDFTNNGTFIHHNNTTLFNGNSKQIITGATTFYNLIKQLTDTLQLNNNIQIDNNLRIESGVIADGGNTIKALSNVYNNGIHTYGGSLNSSTQLGIQMSGASAQEVSGSGTFGKLTIENTNGVFLPIGNAILITNALRLNQGIFDIQGNLLSLGVNCSIEGSGFNPFKMIQTHISFTDFGIKKTFPVGAQTFTYPIGSQGKYTPVTFNITSNTNNFGSITIKAANEIHPSIVDDMEPCEFVDMDNVLQYHWVVRSNSISGFSGNAVMQAYGNDVEIDDPNCEQDSSDYITARILSGSIYWNKFTPDKFNGSNNTLVFDYRNTNDNGISGDYTAGLDEAIPGTVAVYETTNSGDWTNTSIWRSVPAGEDVPAGGPRGAMVIINSGHTVNVANNGDVFVYRDSINGILNLNSTTQHRLGYVYGAGTIRVVNQSTLPAGDYNGTNGFNTAAGGTIEYGGSVDYSVLSNLPIFNNVLFSGTGFRDLPNLDLLARGSITINGPTVRNISDRNIEIHRNFSLISGAFIMKYSGGSPWITFGGANPQIISGNFLASNNSALYNLRINKSSLGLTLSSPIEVANQLTLSDGYVNTSSSNTLTLTNPLNSISSGGSSNSFVDGPLRKWIDDGDSFVFPVGNDNRYSQTWVNPSTTATAGYWTAQYFNQEPPTALFSEPLKVVSNNEYWMVSSPSGPVHANVQIRWDDASGMPTDPTRLSSMRIADRTVAEWRELDPGNIINGTQSSGTVTSNSSTVPSFNQTRFFTLSSIYSPQLFEWTGLNSTAWNLSGNWNQLAIPTAVDDVVIPNSDLTSNDPILTGQYVCRAFTINANGLLTINGGGSLTAYGNTINNGTLVLASPSNNGMSGSFIDNGNISGDGRVRVQRYITRGSFHYLSAPISRGNATSKLFTDFGSRFNANFYSYNEASDLDSNPGTSPSGAYNSDNLSGGWTFVQSSPGNPVAMNTGQGYAFSTDINGIVTFNGRSDSLNTGNQSVSNLSFTNNDPMPGPLPTYYDGWHMVGNPYPSCIDWNLVSGGLVNLDNAIYVWDGSQYASYVAGIAGGTGTQNRYIAPMQGFFVHANANNAGFTLNNSHRVHSPTTTFKKLKAASDPENLISLKLLANGKTDAAVIYFVSDASKEFDGNYDAFRIFSWNNDVSNNNHKDVPHLFTITEGRKTALSISALPEEQVGNTVIPLGIRIGTSGLYTITRDQLNFANQHIYLVDKLEKKTVYLNNEPSYSFNFTAGDKRDRFELRFKANRAPIVKNQISKNTTNEKSAYLQGIIDAFEELDEYDQIVSYEATLPDGSALPAWLSFDATSKTFSGTPQNNDVGVVSISLKAKDVQGGTSEQLFDLEVLNVNDLPVLNNQIPDQEVNINETYAYNLEQNLFSDVDKGDELTLTAKLSNGSPLPSWLGFNKNTRQFYGTAGVVGDLNIQITATDKAGASVSDEFILSVKSTTGIEEFKEDEVLVYPNPTQGKFAINVGKLKADTRVYIRDNSGKLLVNKQIKDVISNFDISTFSNGVYFIELRKGEESKVYKLILQK
jgi:hypothetical protein